MTQHHVAHRKKPRIGWHLQRSARHRRAVEARWKHSDPPARRRSPAGFELVGSISNAWDLPPALALRELEPKATGGGKIEAAAPPAFPAHDFLSKPPGHCRIFLAATWRADSETGRRLIFRFAGCRGSRILNPPGRRFQSQRSGVRLMYAVCYHPTMADEFESDLEMAIRHVAEARRIVEEQRRRIAKLNDGGKPTFRVEQMLRAFETTLQIFEDEERRIRERMGIPK
ncbi:MAG: hypothetical protein WCD69_23175 [Xanthobacteraceae bacterium]